LAEVTFDFTHDKQSRSASPAQPGTGCTPHRSGRDQPCRSHRPCTSSSCHSAATPASTLRTALSCLPCRVGNRHRCCGRCAAACRLRRQYTSRHPSLQTQPPPVKKNHPRWEKKGGSVAPCCSAGHGSQPMGPILLPSASGSGLRQTEVSYRSLACEGVLGAHLACAGIWPAAHTEHTPFPSCVVAFPSGQARQRCLSCDGSFPSTHSTQVPSS